MKKKIGLLLLAVLLLTAVISAVVSFVSTSENVVTMTKVVRGKGEVGKFDLSLENKKLEQIDGKACLQIKIDSFDDLDNIWSFADWERSSENMPGEIWSWENSSYQMVFCVSRDEDGNVLAMPVLKFDPDFDRWALSVGGDITYVGSISGDYTVEELLDFFGQSYLIK